MRTQVPFKMTVLSNGSKQSFLCFQFPLSKWDLGSVCDITTNKSIQLNINFQIQHIMWVIIIIQGFRSTSKRGPQETPHIGQQNSFIWFCWNHFNTFADLINTLCSAGWIRCSPQVLFTSEMHGDYQSDSGRGTFFDDRSVSECVSNPFYPIPYLSLVMLTLTRKVQLIDLENLTKTSKSIATKRIVATPAKDSLALGRCSSPILQVFSQ